MTCWEVSEPQNDRWALLLVRRPQAASEIGRKKRKDKYVGISEGSRGLLPKFFPLCPELSPSLFLEACLLATERERCYLKCPPTAVTLLSSQECSRGEC